jgi:hypothetical protein
MTRLLLTVAALLLPLAAAGELADLHARLAEPVETAPAEPGREGPLVAPHPPLPDVARIGLERSNCFTGCAAFTLIIEEDGRFRYVGETNVERLGEWSGQIEKGALNQVLRYVAAIDYLKLDDTYLSPFLDNPASYTLVEMDGVTKVIENYSNSAPATVWALERLIEDLLDVAIWD